MEQLGAETKFAQIVDLMESASTQKPRLAQLADKVAAPFLVVVLLLRAPQPCTGGVPTPDRH